MSAYVVDDITINRVVGWIFHKAMGENHDYTIQSLKELGYILDTPIGCKRLAEDMFTLNCDSIEQRYGEGSAKDFRELDFKYRQVSFAETDKIHQVLKSLQCFIYQSCEGDNPKNSLLFNALEKLSDRICYNIATSATQYDKAEWQ